MADDGRILPARFEFYVEPVSLVEALRLPYLPELDVHGIDFRFLEGDAELGTFRRKGYGHRRITAGDVRQYLGDPAPVLTFDLDQLERAGEIPTAFDVTRRVEHAGTLDGFCVWFRATFDQQTGFSTAPLDPWTHWTNRLYRTRQRQVLPGDEIGYRFLMDDPLRPGTWSVAAVDHPCGAHAA